MTLGTVMLTWFNAVIRWYSRKKQINRMKYKKQKIKQTRLSQSFSARVMYDSGSLTANEKQMDCIGENFVVASTTVVKRFHLSWHLDWNFPGICNNRHITMAENTITASIAPTPPPHIQLTRWRPAFKMWTHAGRSISISSTCVERRVTNGSGINVDLAPELMIA